MAYGDDRVSFFWRHIGERLLLLPCCGMTCILLGVGDWMLQGGVLFEVGLFIWSQY